MNKPTPVPGLVINYSYLWRDEKHQGLEEGKKIRPCLIATVYNDKQNRQRVGVMPITHATPNSPDHAVEVPLRVTQHLGLDDDKQWIVTLEYNDFLWPGGDMYPVGNGNNKGLFHYGEVPAQLFKMARDQLLKTAREGPGVTPVNRDFDPRAEQKESIKQRGRSPEPNDE